LSVHVAPASILTATVATEVVPSEVVVTWLPPMKSVPLFSIDVEARAALVEPKNEVGNVN